MRIEPTGSPPVSPKAVNSAPRPATPAVGGTASATGGVAEVGAFAPSGDLASLLAAVHQTPDVRPEAIESAAAQLSTGGLNTPAAATDTAKALLSSGDLTPNQ